VKVVRPFYGSQWRDGGAVVSLPDKFTGAQLAQVHETAPAAVPEALAALSRGQRRAHLTPYARSRLLASAAEALEARAEAFAESIVDDTGFTLTDARREVIRAIQTLTVTAEEAKRLTGEMVPLDGAPTGAGRLGFTIFRPLGVVCAITPFNSPLNTVLHKIGPALAAGNAVALKPADQTPLTAQLLVELLLEAGVPPELIAFLPGPGETVGEALLSSQVPAFYAFTGSTEVGRHVRAAVGIRPSQLEMGSISSTLICGDANLEACIPKCVDAAFRKAGQVCTSVQRLYVDAACYDEAVGRLADALRDRPVGDPRDERTFTGPLISPQATERVRSWVAEAVSQGAKPVYESTAGRAVLGPTVLGDVRADSKLMCQEIFGPVVVARRFSDFEAALTEVNGTPYGLAAGVFTRDITRALRAAERLETGSVHINETSSSRVDLMPYSGAKASGLGKEGPRYAIREMSQERLITVGLP
jgi:succinate-semialdehyde dehydrogenase/glutarate-semialdehyde dehydrogenase